MLLSKNLMITSFLYDKINKKREKFFARGESMSVIEIQNLTRDYGSGKGVFDLSISVDAGEVFGFLGPNGAGKTTTIRHLMGFIKPRKGNCRIDGMDCWTQRDVIQKRLGYIPGEISFFDDMTGEEFLRFNLAYRNLKDDDKMRDMIERFELDTKGKIKKMSKGMKQKIGIVAALCTIPRYCSWMSPQAVWIL